MDSKTDLIYVSGQNGGVPVISGKTNKVITTISGTAALGSDIAADQATDQIYQIGFNGSAVINGQTSTVTGGFGVLHDLGVAVNQATDTIYAAGNAGWGLTAVSGKTNTITKMVLLGVGSGSDSVAVDQVTNTIYVTNWNFSTVSVISGRTLTVTKTIRLACGVTYRTSQSCSGCPARPRRGAWPSAATPPAWSGNGSAWRQLTGHATATGVLNAVSCASTCIAVGDSGLSEAWNGARWRVLPPMTNAAAGSAVSCASPSFCMAVGGGNAQAWNGLDWTTRATGP